MAELTPNVIQLRGDYTPTKEAQANGVITPGDILARDTAGTVSRAIAAGAGVSQGPVRVAQFNTHLGQGIDDDWADGDRVKFYIAQPGDEFYAFVAPGQNVPANAMLACAADGALALVAGGTVPVAQALEAVDNSGGAEKVRIKIETL